MKIRFVSNYETKSEPSVSYEVGQVIECSNATASHFINRNLAVEVEAGEVKAEPKKSETVSTGGSSQPDPASPKKTPAKRGRPRKKAVEESSSSTTTTDTQN